MQPPRPAPTRTIGARPNLYLVSPADRELLEGYSSTPLTPYRMGFECHCYQRVYANPFPVSSAAWRSYEAGHADARAQRRGRL